MHKFYLILVLLIGITSLVRSETKEPINTDRPGQTNNPHTVGKDVIQQQSGYKYDKFYGFDIMSLNYVLRYGLAEKFEIHGGFVLSYDLGATNSTINIDNFLIGARYNILKKDGYIPGIGVKSELELSSFTNDFNQDYFNFLLSLDQLIISGLSAGFNLIYNTEIGFQKNYSAYTLYTSYSFDNFGILLEIFGDNSEMYKNYEPNYDIGLSYQFDESLIVDLTYGKFYEYYNESNFFVELGLTYRVTPN